MEYRYVLLKGSWGIVIQVKATITELNGAVGALEIAKNIYLDLSEVRLNKACNSFLENGLKWFFGEKKNIHSIEKNLLIKIVEIEFNVSFFQENALFFAIAEWAGLFFDMKVPQYETFFDKDKNKYIFICGGEEIV